MLRSRLALSEKRSYSRDTPVAVSTPSTPVVVSNTMSQSREQELLREMAALGLGVKCAR